MFYLKNMLLLHKSGNVDGGMMNDETPTTVVGELGEKV